MIGTKHINEWIGLIREKDCQLISQLRTVYGDNKKVLEEKIQTLLNLTTAFRDVFGLKDVRIVRAPGRLNTLGMHIDHRAGFVNPIALDREIVFCYAKRNDDVIEAYNLDPSFGQRNFRINDEFPPFRISTVDEWLAWTQEETDKRKQAGTNDDWINKLKAVPVYFHVLYPDQNLFGYETVISSNLPPGIGLSSSSAIVVASMEIMTDINNISLSVSDYIKYSGIAEWYVGTRGGSGDHAAIKCSRLGMITHVKTLPSLLIDSFIPYPHDYLLIIFNSGIKADKTGVARQKFNEKTATYEIGEIYVRKWMKDYHGDILQKVIDGRADLGNEKKFYLADLVECLDQEDIYKLLQSLPERINRKGLSNQFPEEKTLLKQQFATHDEPVDGYQIRGVLTYGIAESERSRMIKEVLNQKKVDVFGMLMNVSHDGDSVSSMEQKFNSKRDLYLQPGGYGCSIREIDEMVEIALETGAIGAQISGAGLGGSMMALVPSERVDSVIHALNTRYYEPRKLKEEMLSAYPIQGAGIL